MSGGGGRTLDDDFDEGDLPGGPLDLETGSQVGRADAVSSHDVGGIDFDDGLYGDDEGTGGALELDLPGGGPAATRLAPGPARPAAPPAPGPVVPDLDLAPLPARQPAPPPPSSSGRLVARPSGSHQAAGHAPPQPAPHDPAPHGPGPASSSGPQAAHAGMAAPPAAAPPPPTPAAPPRPAPAAVIANYPAPPEQILGAPRYAIRILVRQFELRSELESLRRRRSPDVPLYEAALRTYDAKTFRLGMAINCAVLTIATFVFFLPVIIRFMRAD